MRKISNKKIKNLLKNHKKIFIILTLILALIIGIIFGILKAQNESNLISNVTSIYNITSDNIKINFSTNEITPDNVRITLSTSTQFDIYYYIDLKDNENLEQITLAPETSTNQIPNSSYIKYKNEIIIENNATIYLKYANKNNFCESAYIFEVNNIDKQGPTIGEIITSSSQSNINISVTATDNTNPNFTYYFRLSENEEFICTNELNNYTFENLEADKDYTIFIKVADGFGNESEAVADCKVSKTQESPKKEDTAKKQKYYIKINLAANTVTIYTTDENNEYTKPVKAMICSVGDATPKSGKYNITYKYRWLALFGNVYGQYSTRIVGSILFHSVPYYKTEPNTLKYKEFDKLGTKASAGCIRLMVKDAKWIYDNVASGTTVEFYSDANNPGPLGKPTAPKISNSQYKDWDPTDPDERNPWNNNSTPENNTTGNENTLPENNTNNSENSDTNPNNTVNNNTINNNTVSNNTVNNNTVNNNTVSNNTVNNNTVSNNTVNNNTVSNNTVNNNTVSNNTVNNNTVSNNTVNNNTVSNNAVNNNTVSNNTVNNNTVSNNTINNNTVNNNTVNNNTVSNNTVSNNTVNNNISNNN